MEAAPQVAKAPVFETTWLQGVVEFECRPTPNDGKILVYTLGNGHQYAIPLNAHLLELTRKALSPVVIAGAGDIPTNGHGARR